MNRYQLNHSAPKCNDSHDNNANDNTWLLQWLLEIFLGKNSAR